VGKNLLPHGRGCAQVALPAAFSSRCQTTKEVEEMIPIPTRSGWESASRGIAAVVLLGWSAQSASAETLTIRNQSNSAVIVQVAGIHRGVFRRDRPHLLQPGETTPVLLVPGDKILTLFDAKVLNRILYQGTLPSSSLDRRFVILPDLASSRVRLQRLPGP
jgi:hypothetical protein